LDGVFVATMINRVQRCLASALMRKNKRLGHSSLAAPSAEQPILAPIFQQSVTATPAV